jgi:hypothetical protein
MFLLDANASESQKELNERATNMDTSNITVIAVVITAIATVLLALFNRKYIQKIDIQNATIKEHLEISRKSFSKSLEPSLLLMAVQGDPITQIHYVNTSRNTFYDLNIICKIKFLNQELDYSWLFERNMYMAPKDQRVRQFKLIEDLLNKGHDIKDFASRGNEVLLLLSFSYTFEGENKEYKVQNYKWEVETNSWTIK